MELRKPNVIRDHITQFKSQKPQIVKRSGSIHTATEEALLGELFSHHNENSLTSLTSVTSFK
ncbi:MAG: hypothetical protein ACJA11_001424 [Glaciecola sp.]|jgi:hypothetical protein